MSDRNLLDSLEGLSPVGNVIYGMENVGAVIPRSAGVANTDHDIFKDDESFLVLESLALHLLRAHGAFAVFAAIAVHGLSIMAKASNEKPVEAGCEPNSARGPSRKTAGLETLRGSRVNAAE